MPFPSEETTPPVTNTYFVMGRQSQIRNLSMGCHSQIHNLSWAFMIPEKAYSNKLRRIAKRAAWRDHVDQSYTNPLFYTPFVTGNTSREGCFNGSFLAQMKWPSWKLVGQRPAPSKSQLLIMSDVSSTFLDSRYLEPVQTSQIRGTVERAAWGKQNGIRKAKSATPPKFCLLAI